VFVALPGDLRVAEEEEEEEVLVRGGLMPTWAPIPLLKEPVWVP
jgi:hypothetical protein